MSLHINISFLLASALSACPTFRYFIILGLLSIASHLSIPSHTVTLVIPRSPLRQL
ncbi:hypothetical protein BDR06DRAFT_147143 [Suillus hirtellus]|nr:hypothetical protein BDR06DRAFT_147143 [Suillus hirtellus]